MQASAATPVPFLPSFPARSTSQQSIDAHGLSLPSPHVLFAEFWQDKGPHAVEHPHQHPTTCDDLTQPPETPLPRSPARAFFASRSTTPESEWEGTAAHPGRVGSGSSALLSGGSLDRLVRRASGSAQAAGGGGHAADQPQPRKASSQWSGLTGWLCACCRTGHESV